MRTRRTTVTLISDPRWIDQEVCRGVESLGEFKGIHTLNMFFVSCEHNVIGDKVSAPAATWRTRPPLGANAQAHSDNKVIMECKV